MNKTLSTWQRLKSNPQFREYLVTRSRVIRAIRDYFTSQGFLEVDTPQLVKNPGTEPYLEVFESVLKTDRGLHVPAYLTTSPELQMKKLLAGDMGSIFQICKSYRNGEGISSRHNHEFTILEWYRINADYTDVMEDCKGLLRFIWRQLHPESTESATLSYKGKTFDLDAEWAAISIPEAFEKYAGIDIDTLLDQKALVQAAAQKGYQVTAQTTWEEAYNQILLNEIEQHLGESAPEFLYDYPVSQAALSRKKKEDPRLAERFELYIGGLELGNAFSELTDADEQESRMVADLKERDALGKTKYELDSDFIAALRSGMPPTGGIAVGVDRLVALFAGAQTVQDVIPFPTSELFGIDE